MNTSFARAGLLLAVLALAGCNGTLEDIAPKAEKSLPPALVQSMRVKGMTQTSPIMVRIFKEEAKLEVWKRKDNDVRGNFVVNSEIVLCICQMHRKHTIFYKGRDVMRHLSFRNNEYSCFAFFKHAH